MTITIQNKDGLQISIGTSVDKRIKAVIPGPTPTEFLIKMRSPQQAEVIFRELKAWGLRVVLARKLRGVIVYKD
jgi:hypothetical protein